MNKYDEFQALVGRLMFLFSIIIFIAFFISIGVVRGLSNFSDENLIIFDMVLAIGFFAFLISWIISFAKSKAKSIFGRTSKEIFFGIVQMILSVCIIWFFISISSSVGYGGSESIIDKYEEGALNILVINDRNQNYEIICNQKDYNKVEINEPVLMDYRLFSLSQRYGLLIEIEKVN